MNILAIVLAMLTVICSAESCTEEVTIKKDDIDEKKYKIFRG